MDEVISIDAIASSFARQFGGQPEIVVRAPGRVNLIGEHTDYNEGFVLPLAIDRHVMLAARRRTDSRVIAWAASFAQRSEFELPAAARVVPRGGDWSAYLRAVAWAIAREGHRLVGMDVLVAGSVPIGAGLSSSAAFEVAVALAIQWLAGLDFSMLEIARLCQAAESDFVGVRCGIMDQFAITHGRAGHAILLDCHDLSFRYVPLPEAISVVVIDSAIRRALGDTAYNERTAQCAEAVRILQERWPHVRSLRDLDVDELKDQLPALPEPLARRARHVVTENLRVQRAANALADGDLPRVGRLMVEAHDSLRDDYEVSLPELDRLVEIALAAGAIGARLTGAGFGGCVAALVPLAAVPAFGDQVADAYRRATARRATIHVCAAAEGARWSWHHV